MHLSSRPNQCFPSVGSELASQKDLHLAAKMLGPRGPGGRLGMNPGAPPEENRILQETNDLRTGRWPDPTREVAKLRGDPVAAERSAPSAGDIRVHPVAWSVESSSNPHNNKKGKEKAPALPIGGAD